MVPVLVETRAWLLLPQPLDKSWVVLRRNMIVDGLGISPHGALIFTRRRSVVGLRSVPMRGRKVKDGLPSGNQSLQLAVDTLSGTVCGQWLLDSLPILHPQNE